LLILCWSAAFLAIVALGLYLAGMIGYGYPMMLILAFVIVYSVRNARRNRE